MVSFESEAPHFLTERAWHGQMPSERLEELPGFNQFVQPCPVREMHRCSIIPPIESTRLAGEYALPVAAPDLVGDREEVDKSFPRPTIPHFRSFDESTFASRCPDRSHSRWQRWRGVLGHCVVITVFLLSDTGKSIFSSWAFNGKGALLIQSFVVLQCFVSLAAGLVISVAFEGVRGLRTALCSPREVLRCFLVAVCFTLGQSALAFAYDGGLRADKVGVLGYLYMPLCAILSRCIFHRHYGWLEIHALVFLTLTTMVFTELSRRRGTGVEVSQSNWAIAWCLISIVLACVASLVAERFLKPKYSPTSGAQHFYVQKVWLDLGGVLTACVTLGGLSAAAGQTRPIVPVDWDLWMGLALALRILQSWLAGLIAKRLSTVAKAVIQSCGVLLLFAIAVIQGHSETLADGMLILLVAMSAIMYQIGRSLTGTAAQTGAAPVQDTAAVPQGDSVPEGAHAVLVPAINRSLSDPTFHRAPLATRSGSTRAKGRYVTVRLLRGSGAAALLPDGHTLAAQEFDLSEGEGQPGALSGDRRCPTLERVNLIDQAWLEQARAYNSRLASWMSSRVGLSSQVLCVVSFILSDASRTLIYAWAIHGTPIVQQSLVLCMSLASIPIGLVLSAVLDGVHGVKAALVPWDALRCLPVAACFSFGTTLQLKAYGSGISASVNTVLGYFYMPLSALLSRWVFQRAYSGLEWLALTLLALSAVVFVLLKDGRDGSSTSLEAVLCCFGSVITSCIGSLVCEKIMKAQRRPFYTQKVHLETGGLATSIAMLFVAGYASNEDADAFWKRRDVGNGVMLSGIFVGWSFRTVLALTVTVLQSWLGGLVSKRLSTVVRSVAQCLSLLIIYFVGDLILKGLTFDWVEGAAAVVVALSVQVFTLAGQRTKGKRRFPAVQGLESGSGASGQGQYD